MLFCGTGEVVQWEPGDWMRPVSDMEHVWATAGYFNFLSTTQAMWITSKEQLSKNLVEVALQHLVS